MGKIESEVYNMYPEYMLIQIIEVPKNGNSSPYAVRYYGRMEYFDFDFMCKNTLKKFFTDNNMTSGEYMIIHDNESNGDKFVVDAVCVYRTKESGNFLDFKLAGQEWIDLVNVTMDKTPVVDIGLKIQTINKVTIPKMVCAATPESTDTISE